MSNPERERDRLTALYAGMSDEELAQIAETGYELSDVARQALQAEIAGRGADIVIAPDPGFDVYEPNKTVTVGQFRDLHEALLARGCLESAGIHAELFEDNMVRLDWFYSNLVGGVKLKFVRKILKLQARFSSNPFRSNLRSKASGTTISQNVRNADRWM